MPLAIKHRQPRQLDRKSFVAIIHRPGHRDAAPGFARGYGTRHLLFRIELQLIRDFAPQSAERGRGLRSREFDKLVRTDDEAAIGIHLPDEPQWMPALGDWLRRRMTACRRYRSGSTGLNRR